MGMFMENLKLTFIAFYMGICSYKLTLGCVYIQNSLIGKQ
jgi:hypothetical protein